MKCRGGVRTLSAGGCIARASLGPRASEHKEDFQLHPVFLDCSTVVPMYGWHSHLDDVRLFIPFGIDEFQATSLQGLDEVFIQVSPSIGNDAESELLRNSFTLFSIDGEPLARFKNFTVKRVRSLQNVRHLLTSGTSARKQNVGPGSSTSPPVGNSKLKQLVLTLVEQLGQLKLGPEQETTSFFDLGLDSLVLLDMGEALESRLGVKLYPTLLFEHTSISTLTSYLNQTFPAEVAALGAEVVQRVQHSMGMSALIFQLIEQRTSIQLDPERDGSTPFFELGIDSIALLDICESLSLELDIELYPTLLFEHQSVSALSDWLTNEHSEVAVAYAPGRRISSTTALDSSPDVKTAQEQLHVYLPRWLPVSAESSNPVHASGSRVALITAAAWSSAAQSLRDILSHDLVLEVGVTSPADEAVFSEAFGRGIEFDQLWCLGIDHNDVFLLLQELILIDRFSKPLQVNLITDRAYSVHGEPINKKSAHGAWGLLQTASREYPSLRVAQLDVSGTGSLTEIDMALFSVDMPRRLLAVREGRNYQRYLLPVHDLEPATTRWRSGGVYLIIGGSGGIGLALLYRLCEQHKARVAIMGRRTLEELPEVRRAIEQFGSRVFYRQGHADSEADLVRMLKEVKANLGDLHGIIHAPMVLNDKRLVDMSRSDFQLVLTPKVDGIDALSNVLSDIELDFILIFSSLQSFVGNAAQGNYAAASTYLDGQALALGQVLDVPVSVINWGVWNDVGAVATAVHRKLLSRQAVSYTHLTLPTICSV